MKKISVLFLILLFNFNIAYSNEVENNQNQSNFLSFTGTIIEILDEPESTNDEFEMFTIIIEDDEQGIAIFNIFNNTFILGEAPVVGQSATGYFLAMGPMPLIYPPHYNIVVLSTLQEEDLFTETDSRLVSQNIKVDLFMETDGQLISIDNMLQITIGDETVIEDTFGEQFTGDLAGRNLVVLYGVSTRSIPAMTTPDRIIVLPVEGITPELPIVTPGGIDGLPELGEPPLPPSTNGAHIEVNLPEFYPIIINGIGLQNADFHFITANGTEEVFVPLRVIVESLNGVVGWNNETQEIMVNDNISFVLGDTEFFLEGESIALSPSKLIDEVAYVPLNFFRLVFGMNNAFFEGGQVTIDNEEQIQ